ncbi:MAG: putative metalloprotease CJM1_0395 family protein [Planctomycetota bacterium]
MAIELLQSAGLLQAVPATAFPAEPKADDDDAAPDLLGRVRGDRVEISPEAQALFGRDTSDGLQSDDSGGDEDAAALGDESDPAAAVSADSDVQLNDDEKRQVEELKQRDAEVRAHEQAHLSALGGEGGAANYEYTTGPDGRRYATGGEVPVSIGEAPSGNPRETIASAQRVARAAVAPAQPSGADLSARARALQVEREARAQLREQQEEAAEEATGATDETEGGDAADRADRGDEAQPAEAKPVDNSKVANPEPIDLSAFLKA